MYFRITNGNTQVSATEIKSVKFPEASKICEIGVMLKNIPELNYESVDTIVNDVLEL